LRGVIDTEANDSYGTHREVARPCDRSIAREAIRLAVPIDVEAAMTGGGRRQEAA
jgi:hypothetical protein